MSLVFLDTETTGLEFHHDIWEIAWAVDDGPIESSVIPHSIRNADPRALELNGYLARHANMTPQNAFAELRLRAALEGNTIVAANPCFDATRLQLRWGCAPWHYRVIDVSAMSIPVLGMNDVEITGPDGKPMTIQQPKGLWDIANELNDYGMGIPLPDHTAAADVAALRAVYHGLMLISAGTIGRVS